MFKTSPELWLERNLGFERPKPGLERVKSAIEALGLEFSGAKFVTVGGTNGKGECARRLYRMALDETSAALWTSPHLKSVTERFSKDGEFVDEQDLLKLFEATLGKTRQAGLSLSYYEFLFLVFLVFAQDCPLLILEVGLGGRWDAVNAIDADLVLLTSISRDHQEYLGPRYDGILAEKIALARPGKELVTNFELGYLRGLARQESLRRGFTWSDLFELGACRLGHTFSRRNQELAAKAFEKLFGRRPDLKTISEEGPLVEFTYEGALCHALPSHNPDGVRKGVQFLNEAKYTKSYKFVLLSFSERSFKDAMTMLKTVRLWLEKSAKNTELAITAFSHPKAMEGPKLKQLARQAQVNYFDEPKEFFETYRPRDKDVFVLGSNYFIGALCGERGFARR